MKFLKMSDVCARYNITRSVLYRWRKNMGFPASITPERSYPIWRLVDIEVWEQNNMLNN